MSFFSSKFQREFFSFSFLPSQPPPKLCLINCSCQDLSIKHSFGGVRLDKNEKMKKFTLKFRRKKRHLTPTPYLTKVHWSVWSKNEADPPQTKSTLTSYLAPRNPQAMTAEQVKMVPSPHLQNHHKEGKKTCLFSHIYNTQQIHRRIHPK